MRSVELDHIEELVAKGRLHQAVNQLREAVTAQSEFHLEATLLLTSINQLDRDWRRGVITREEYAVSKAKLVERILDVAKQVTDSACLPSTPTPIAPRTGNESSSDRYRAAVEPIEKRWALLVGINHYKEPHFAPLRFCVNDVNALKKRLGELHYETLVLSDEFMENRLEPTKANIKAEVAQICQLAGPNDLIFLHFACHGILANGEPFLVCRDTRMQTLGESGLRIGELQSQLLAGRARRLILSLDACHVGIQTGRGSDVEFVRHVYELAEGFALISASTAEQQAQEWEKNETGVYTYFLLDALSGGADRANKSFVTVHDLFTHVVDELRRWSFQHGILQEPTIRIEGIGDIIVADFR